MGTMTSVELFAGAGGLAMGVSLAGFQHEAVVEMDHDACETIRANQSADMEPVRHWKLLEADVKGLDYRNIKPDIDLLAAGVPCQPWSIGGKHRGFEDSRNLFPDTIRAVLALTPRAILIENVKGLTRPSLPTISHIFNGCCAFPKSSASLLKLGKITGRDWNALSLPMARVTPAYDTTYSLSW